MQAKHTNVINKLKGKTTVKQVASYKIVYRLEHANDHVGPFQYQNYRNSEKYGEFEARCYDDRWLQNHPTPEREGVNPFIILGSYHGCKDMKQLKDWFGEFLEYFVHEENFQVVKYYVRIQAIVYTETQALFDPSEVIKTEIVNSI